MTAIAFDSYRIVKRLRGAGFTEDQAEAVTTAIQDSASLDLSNLATKDQVAALDAKVVTLTTKEHLDAVKERAEVVKERLAALEARVATMATNEQVAAVKEQLATLDARVATFEAKIASREQLAALDAKIAAVETKMATKEQLAALDAKFDAKIAALDARIAALETKVAALDTKIDLTAARLEERIERRGAESDARMVRWVVGTGIAAVLSLGGMLAGATTMILRALPATH